MLFAVIFGATFAIAIYVWAFICVYRNRRRLKQEGKLPDKTDSSLDNSAEMDLGTKLMLGALGAEILNRQIEKEKEKREKDRYDSLYWQESIRDKEHNYVQDDDWL